MNFEELVKKFKEKEEKLNKELGLANDSYEDKDRIKVSWIPSGIHKVRIFPDKNGEFVEGRWMHKIPVYGDDGEVRNIYVPCTGNDCPIHKVIETYNLHYSYNARRIVKSIMYLIDSNNESDYWQANSLYLVVGTTKGYASSLMSHISSVFESGADIAQRYFDPTQGAPGTTQIEVIRGKGGRIGFSSVLVPAPPLPDELLNILKEVDLRTDYIDFSVEYTDSELENFASQFEEIVLQNRKEKETESEALQEDQFEDNAEGSPKASPDCIGTITREKLTTEKCSSCEHLSQCIALAGGV